MTDAHTDPLATLATWIDDAARRGLGQPESMALATCTADGKPSVRIVLFRGMHEGGLAFFTNYESRKAVELDANPFASVAFHWEPFARQVRIEGPVTRASAKTSDDYFAGRPRGSQVTAWASPQSRPIDPKALDAAIEATDAEYAGRPVPRPPFWGGYLLRPRAVELWIGAESRRHERLLYERSGEADPWRLTILGP